MFSSRPTFFSLRRLQIVTSHNLALFQSWTMKHLLLFFLSLLFVPFAHLPAAEPPQSVTEQVSVLKCDRANKTQSN